MTAANPRAVLSSLFLTCCAALSHGQANTPTDMPEPGLKVPGPTLDQQLKGAMTPLLIKHRVPAVAVALFDSDAVLGKAASGLRARGFPDSVTTADRWHIGSCTKAFTATLIGSLVDSGLLKWDVTLAEALPDAADTMNEAFKKVTLRDLLRHRAGLASFTAGNSPDFEMLKNLPGDVRQQRAAFVRTLLSHDPALPPGTKQFYSNASYTVAAAIAEQAANKPYTQLMQERVFDIVAMPSAGFGWPAREDRRDEPRGHMPGILGARPEAFDPKYKFSQVLAPAGDINCTIDELAMFAAAHMKGLREATAKPGEKPAGAPGQPARLRLLRPATILELHTPIDGYAGGWVINDRKDPAWHWHNGSAGTFFTLMVIVPERNLGAVAVCNAADGEKACQELIEIALAMKP